MNLNCSCPKHGARVTLIDGHTILSFLTVLTKLLEARLSSTDIFHVPFDELSLSRSYEIPCQVRSSTCWIEYRVRSQASSEYSKETIVANNEPRNRESRSITCSTAQTAKARCSGRPPAFEAAQCQDLPNLRSLFGGLGTE